MRGSIQNAPAKRRRLSEQQNHRCCYCGVETTEEKHKPNTATIDHVIARCLGGSDHMDNLVLACARCNAKKSVKEQAKLVKYHIKLSVFGGFDICFQRKIVAHFKSYDVSVDYCAQCNGSG